jgi:AcrR family transcriptional regulator
MTSSSSLRRDQGNAVRERILAAAIAVVENGEEPNMRTVAIAASIAERTLYRYFPSREELHAALAQAVRGRAGAPMADDVSGLERYVHVLYTTFDRNARLTRALLSAAWAPANVRRTANLRALRAIIDAGFPRAPLADRASAAASLRIPLSAAGWQYLADCAFDLAESIAHVQWLVRTVIEKLQHSSGGRHA